MQGLPGSLRSLTAIWQTAGCTSGAATSHSRDPIILQWAARTSPDSANQCSRVGRRAPAPGCSGTWAPVRPLKFCPLPALQVRRRRVALGSPRVRQ